ncbi:hypothetical protein VSH64_06610 [Amycolatopsis rhabdoformis]|uniref:DUF5671 domain-containing protein n=1 Tax=Amycolatopsis rhabdoformis TaxID=1448059 RepID=A0ABZ1IC44_9PSEU|nr:hypothetical protein [Amycolatopsis rhabdoformis]WSE31777.1 hypothetical protein VSH64_06610 [Amycolatopsis rhabdoformis]
MPDEGDVTGRLEHWVRAVGSVVAPATLLSALLFYFGYVSTRSQYEYFGIDVDLIGLATQDYVMRSPQPLLTPLLVLTLASVGALVLHSALQRRIAAAQDTARLRFAARVLTAVGLVVLGAGIGLLLLYALVRGWVWYALVTPLLIAVGGVLVVYGFRVLRRLDPGAPAASAVRRVSLALVLVVVGVSLFWTTATIAQWSGRGLALAQARALDGLPSVIVDTKERLFPRSPGIDETALPPAAGQTYHYRYRNLRLLVHGNDRMFLVPRTWSASDTTLVVPLDSSVRVQFQFQNQAP